MKTATEILSRAMTARASYDTDLLFAEYLVSSLQDAGYTIISKAPPKQDVIKIPCTHCGAINPMATFKPGEQFMFACRECGKTISGGIGLNNAPAYQNSQ